MYHDIVSSNDKKSGFQNENAFMYKVDETSFEEQVSALAHNDVLFTFDDGGDSFITKAAPILEKYGKKGMFFISTKYIGNSGFLTEEQIRQLHSRGHRIGSHSHSHPSNISTLKDDDIFAEWAESVEVLSRIIGETIAIASIPNGYASKDVIKQAVRAGITELYTSTPTTRAKIKESIVLRGRYVVHSSSSTNCVLEIVNSKTKRFTMSVKWAMLEAIKSLLGNNYDKVKALIKRH